MVSPMREKRVWPPQDKDADGETAAAFEAAVAVVKETVVRSGEVLVSEGGSQQPPALAESSDRSGRGGPGTARAVAATSTRAPGGD